MAGILFMRGFAMASKLILVDAFKNKAIFRIAFVPVADAREDTGLDPMPILKQAWRDVRV